MKIFGDQILTVEKSEKILRQISKPTTMSEVKSLNIIPRLKKACEKAWTPGLGLAAIQIGIPLRVAWFCWDGYQDFILLNPKITEYKGKKKLCEEGCLSIPDNWAMIRRYYKIKYISDGKPLSAKGFKAQIIQHEIDHMDGILNID